MARSFSKPHRLHVMNELNVTPMLDLCFCLLIIFMISTPVLEQTTAVNLPKAEKGSGKPAEAKQHLRPNLYNAAAKGLNTMGLSDQKYNQILWSIKKLGIPEEQAFLDKNTA